MPELILKALTTDEVKEYMERNGTECEDEDYIQGYWDFVQLCVEQEFHEMCMILDEGLWGEFYERWYNEEDEKDVEEAPMKISWTRFQSIYDEIMEELDAAADNMGIADEEYEGYDYFEF